jgi:hypothetical protein
MKKVLLFSVLILAAASTVFSADFNLGTFPLGKWYDPNYQAVWEFTSNNIRILGTDGSVYWDFADKTVKDFKVAVEGGAPVMTFSCPEAGRSYKFSKPLTNTNIIMNIVKESGIKYKVEMKKQ